jgi:Ubiquitin family
MRLLVHHAKKCTEVHLDNDDADAVIVSELSRAIEGAMDVAVHKQKLILKGKQLEQELSLASYGVKDGSKILLVAGSAATQVRMRLLRAALFNSNTVIVQRVCQPIQQATLPCGT